VGAVLLLEGRRMGIRSAIFCHRDCVLQHILIPLSRKRSCNELCQRLVRPGNLSCVWVCLVIVLGRFIRVYLEKVLKYRVAILRLMCGELGTQAPSGLPSSREITRGWMTRGSLCLQRCTLRFVQKGWEMFRKYPNSSQKKPFSHGNSTEETYGYSTEEAGREAELQSRNQLWRCNRRNAPERPNECKNMWRQNRCGNIICRSQNRPPASHLNHLRPRRPRQ